MKKIIIAVCFMLVLTLIPFGYAVHAEAQQQSNQVDDEYGYEDECEFDDEDYYDNDEEADYCYDDEFDECDGGYEPRTVTDEDGVERTAGTICFHYKDGTEQEMTADELLNAYYDNPYAAKEQYRFNDDIEKISGYDVVDHFGSDGDIYFESGIAVGDEYLVGDPEYPFEGVPGDFVYYEADFLSPSLDDSYEDNEHNGYLYGNGQVLRYWR